MNIENAVITAVRAISKNKMRAALTSVGIIIGVSSVIIMIGIGNSAKVAILDKIKTYGYNAIAVFSEGQQLHDNDLDMMRKSIPQIIYTSPVCSPGKTLVKNQRWNLQSELYGATNEFLIIKQRGIADGREFSEDEISRNDKVAIIGKTIVRELYGDGDPIGQNIIVQDVPYLIIGVLESMGSAFSGYDNDNEIIIPYTTANLKFFNRSFFTDFYISIDDEKNIDICKTQIREFLRNKFRLMDNQEDTFRIYTSKEKMGMAEDISRALAILLAGIASISLVVGGIGIMNIMLVSVTERTREIGIRMAIGAKRRDIMMQFLIESITLSSGGGAIGILLGLLIYSLIVFFTKWPFIFSFGSILISFSFAAGVGIFFGFWPAKKASNLKPIDALKFE
jgi:putative ABC transport system permease protein